MEVTVNGQKIEGAHRAGTLPELLLHLKDVWPEDEIVSRIVLDGKEIDFSQLEELSPVGDGDSLQLATRRMEEAKAEALDMVTAVLGGTQNTFRRAAALVLEGEVEAGGERLLDCTSGLRWSLEIIFRILELDEPFSGGYTVHLLEDLDCELRSVVRTVSSGDEGAIFERLTGKVQSSLEEVRDLCRMLRARQCEGN